VKIIHCSYSSWSGQGNAAAALRGRTSPLISEAILKRKRGLLSIVYMERSKVAIKMRKNNL